MISGVQAQERPQSDENGAEDRQQLSKGRLHGLVFYLLKAGFQMPIDIHSTGVTLSSEIFKPRAF